MPNAMLQRPIQPSRFPSATLRVALAALMLTALLSTTPSTARGETTKQAQPNILPILTDQQFADVMGAAGSKWVKTPGMDAIAARGVRFTNAYVNYPVWLPSRYSMMTGRLPCTRRQADAANNPTISLGNQARNAGYTTAYYGKSAVPLARSTDPSAPTHDYVVTEAEVTSNSGDFHQGRSVRTPQFKFHAWDLGADREQLFDMIKDPGKTHNLAADSQYAAVLDQHRDLLAQWLANTDDTYRMVPAPQKIH